MATMFSRLAYVVCKRCASLSAVELSLLHLPHQKSKVGFPVSEARVRVFPASVCTEKSGNVRPTA